MKIVLPILVILLGAGIFVGTQLFKKSPAETEPEIVPRAVKTTKVEVTTERFDIRTSGFLQARDRSIVSAAVAGPIVDTHERLYPGEFFAAGETLLQIDPADYETQIARAESQIAAQKALLAQEEARAEQALRDWRKLGRSGEAPALVARKPQLAQLRSALDAAVAERDLARTNLSRTTVEAPFDSLVSAKEVEVGHYVTPGAPLLTLLAVDFAEVRLPVDLEDFALLDLESLRNNDSGGEVELRADQGRRTGEIVRTENVVDEATRSMNVIVRLADPYARLSKSETGSISRIQPGDTAPAFAEVFSVGQYVEASLKSRPVKSVSRVPWVAMRGRDEVAVVVEGSLIEIRPVSITYETAEAVFVRGLQNGDEVVLTSPSRALPGEKVDVIDDSVDTVPSKPKPADE
ncbi:MAG: efflux RND transporter periplasmic adaptor subunit [Verrucomicrobiota bacterium]